VERVARIMVLRVFLAVASITIALILSACSTGSSISLLPGLPQLFGTQEAPTQEADACPTPEKCAAQLRILVKDPVRKWVGQPQSADAYANGTRLFAYRALKRKLTCDELRRALVETEAAGPSLQPVRYAGARKLMSEVRRELGAERTKRCRKA
jgi:hypothetical protein